MTQENKKKHTNENREKQVSVTNSDAAQTFARVGLLLAFFAFSLSVMTPWIMQSAPEPPPEITVEEEGISLTQRVSSFIFDGKISIEIKETTEDEVIEPISHWTDYWPMIVLMIALGGVGSGTFGLMNPETRIIGSAAICFGISAIVIQYLLIAFAVLLLVLVVFALLSAMGASF